MTNKRYTDIEMLAMKQFFYAMQRLDLPTGWEGMDYSVTDTLISYRGEG